MVAMIPAMFFFGYMSHWPLWQGRSLAEARVLKAYLLSMIGGFIVLSFKGFATTVREKARLSSKGGTDHGIQR